MRRTSRNCTKWLSFGSFVHSPGVIKKYGRTIGRQWARTSPGFFQPFLKVLKTGWILACGLYFTWETLLWSFFHWVVLCSREITYAKKAHRLEKPSGLLHTQYLENEANFSMKTTEHCLTYRNKTACEIWSVFDKVHFWLKYLTPFSCGVLQIIEAGPLLW